jgi:hypothetical protein
MPGNKFVRHALTTSGVDTVAAQVYSPGAIGGEINRVRENGKKEP